MLNRTTTTTTTTTTITTNNKWHLKKRTNERNKEITT